MLAVLLVVVGPVKLGAILVSFNVCFSKGKAKVKVKLNFPLEQATKAQMWNRAIALLFL